jgi:inositol phosphorylceramide mannosyltransferase catalytic subunit
MKVLKGHELATYKGLNNKTVIQTWHTKEFHKQIKKINMEMKLKNPQLEFLLYNNDEMDNSVEDNFDRDIVKTYFKFLHYVPRADFWRYLMVEKFGCIYLDIDSIITSNINELLNSKKSILTLEPRKTAFIQWVMIFNKNDRGLEAAIEMIIDNVKSNLYKNNVDELTGPSLLTKAILKKINFQVGNNVLEYNNVDLNLRLKEKDYKLLKNQIHDNHFLFKHQYNHLLRNRRKKIFRRPNNEDLNHFVNFQKSNSLY